MTFNHAGTTAMWMQSPLTYHALSWYQNPSGIGNRSIDPVWSLVPGSGEEVLGELRHARAANPRVSLAKQGKALK